jgi:hypothetical protein
MIGTVNAFTIATASLLVNMWQQAVQVEPCEFDTPLIQKTMEDSRCRLAVAAGNCQAKADGF